MPPFASARRSLFNAAPIAWQIWEASGEVQMGAERSATAPPDALIASDRIEGTAVFGPNHRRIGRIERLMIDKKTGQVAYAVLSFGGFLGIGEDHYPLPWATLSYDTALDGYRIDATEQQLRDAPSFGKDDYWDWSGRHEQVHKHYGVDPIWY
jgi:hypothetical protein